MSEQTTTTWPPAVTWDDIPGETARGGVHRRGFGTENVLLVMHDLAPDMDLSPHSHEFDQIAVIVEGEAIYHVGDRRNRPVVRIQDPEADGRVVRQDRA